MPWVDAYDDTQNPIQIFVPDRGDDSQELWLQSGQPVINYRTDIMTENIILFKGVQYNIVSVDVFEGYKSDLTLYCKRQA